MKLVLRVQKHIEHTRLCAGVDRLGTYASIHLNVFVRKPCTEVCNLGEAAFDEFLSATAWEKFFFRQV